VSDEQDTTGISHDDRPTEAFGAAGEGPGVRVRNYRILRQIATGGMGEVYDAEQKEPIRRRVALKVIKWGMDTREVVARFESERQALALMDHPNIAQIFDAGATERGRPYFAMEYVKGVPISEFCDTHQLTTPQRLELFIEVCEGVQHAHQKGIIHRDIKPSNILVELHDDRSLPKIIDFGVAKATAQRLTEHTVYTAHGQFIGTPEYMSPEQAEMSGLDVDTRTDVYSLGVLLYELLVGALPFDSKQLRGGGYDEVRRRIREEEPPRPSTRLTTLGDDSTAAARKRRTDVPSLTRLLRGDLDWIVMKALEKDRTRRYASASELAADIRRYLAKQPVLAGPPSTVYRLKKFAQRHKATVLAASLIFVALVFGIVGTTVGMLRARAAERRASHEAETARQVSDFLVELFEVSDPSEAQGDSVLARDILDHGAERIQRQLDDQPATQARLMDTIGTVYRRLGLYDEASPLLERGLALREQQLGPEHREVADSLISVSALQRSQGRYTEAETLARRAAEIRERELGPHHLDVAEALSSLGWALAKQDRYDEAEPLFQRVLAIQQQHLPADDPLVADSLGDLGITYWRQGRYEEAETLLEQALAIFEEQLGPDDYRVRSTLNDLAVLNWSQGRYDDAVRYLERSLAIKERILGSEHPEVASSLNNLGVLFDAQGRYAEAEPLFERALAIYEKSLGSENDKVAMLLGNLAWVYYRQGKFVQAQPLYARGLEIYERTVGPDHTSVATLLRDNALLHLEMAEYDAAQRQLERALEIREKTFGPEHPAVAECLTALADVYKAQDRFDEAEPLYRRALAIRQEKLDAEHPDSQETREGYADLLRRAGRADEAEALLLR
jgi:serine/threonine protein kinase/tetratricopeptide (TPR) repeat protein